MDEMHDQLLRNLRLKGMCAGESARGSSLTRMR
jgi:hypothetical protein